MKKALVIGCGMSGKSAIDFLQKEGFTLIAVDREPLNKEVGCPVYSDTRIFDPFDFDLVVVSPGVARDHPLYQKARREGISVVGEIELGLRSLSNRCIAVTGSHGKSTTVSLIAHVLNFSGIKARALGNIGVPFLTSLETLERDEIVVLELSSYQLETIETKAFDVAAFINFAPNHLDRYRDIEEYFQTKLKIQEFRKEGAPFYLDEKIPYNGEKISVFENREVLLKVGPPISYHVIGVSFAYTICKEFGVSDALFFESMKTFRGLPHRLEKICSIGDLVCYNDSKATTPDAVAHAVLTIGSNIILLAGGRHKPGGFEKWPSLFKGRVKEVILFGESALFMKSFFDETYSVTVTEDLKEAVEKGLKVAKKNDTLLLSPGCASYDQFRNFEERGETFKRIIEDESKRHNFDCSSH